MVKSEAVTPEEHVLIMLDCTGRPVGSCARWLVTTQAPCLDYWRPATWLHGLPCHPRHNYSRGKS